MVNLPSQDFHLRTASRGFRLIYIVLTSSRLAWRTDCPTRRAPPTSSLAPYRLKYHVRVDYTLYALCLNALVGGLLATYFLPLMNVVGYSGVFLIFSGCTLLYFLLTVFLITETKGKTLEEIEQFFISD